MTNSFPFCYRRSRYFTRDTSSISNKRVFRVLLFFPLPVRIIDSPLPTTFQIRVDLFMEIPFVFPEASDSNRSPLKIIAREISPRRHVYSFRATPGIQVETILELRKWLEFSPEAASISTVLSAKFKILGPLASRQSPFIPSPPLTLYSSDLLKRIGVSYNEIPFSFVFVEKTDSVLHCFPPPRRL